MDYQPVPIPLFLPKNQWPEELKHPRVKGIALDACVNPNNRHWALDDGKSLAHAHCHSFDEFKGWICYNSARQMTRAINLHELAHLTVGFEAAHGGKWLNKYRELAKSSLYNRLVVFWDLFLRASEQARLEFYFQCCARLILFVIIPTLLNAPPMLHLICVCYFIWNTIVLMKNTITLEYHKCANH